MKHPVILSAILFSAVIAGGCEHTAHKTQDAVEDAGDAAEDAGDEIEDATD
ncbi:MAG TPA: hypothetical protein VFX02_12550 [Gammaproteobacteria bacterium]|nr:hypothetical protein [Gammaproteobacteria bacterium]